ncbi:MAG TPA: protease HtpX, partial [Phycisphaeraceae bacterium]|nr:protease HtpX [Phycisphaeraceae bacterium]
MNVFYNNMKTAMLMAGLMALFVLVGSIWGTQGMITALVLGGMMNFVAYFASDKIAIAAMQGREVDATTAPELYAMVDRLRRRAGLPMPR